MGVEVSWHDIKKLCSCQDSLGKLIGCLCHFINTMLGEEHMLLLSAAHACRSNTFICNPVVTKEMRGKLQPPPPFPTTGQNIFPLSHFPTFPLSHFPNFGAAII
jgi:hypothetical protein